MQVQFEYIQNLATIYHTYNTQAEQLYAAINHLSPGTIAEIYHSYGDPDRRYQPVNLIRAEVARQILQGATLNGDLVNEIKSKIRNKDVDYFAPHYSAKFVQELAESKVAKDDIFKNWQNPWRIFHVYFYRGQVKETTQNYLDQMGNALLAALELKDYTFHRVDFHGTSNFGEEFCWLALFPQTKISHQESYQFFLCLADQSEAGQLAGKALSSAVHGAQRSQLKQVQSYAEVLELFQVLKADICRSNQTARNHFKFAPGSQASEWGAFYAQGIAALNYKELNVGNLAQYSSLAELNRAAGLAQDSRSNQTMNLWLFKSANLGDLVFANKGANTCIGIGVITGEYTYIENAEDFNHQRKIHWLTNKEYQYKSDTLNNIKALFRRDTFSPTTLWKFILNEYLRLYPELLPCFEEYHLLEELSASAQEKSLLNDSDSDLLSEEETRPLNFWWLNANPQIWSISDHAEGMRQRYTSHNERGNKRRVYKYFEAVQPGDLIIGYESSPSRLIKAIYEVTQGLHQREGEEVIEFELIEKLEIPVHLNELKNNLGLQNCEVMRNNQGSLFKLSEDEYDLIRDLIDNKNILAEKNLATGPSKKYQFANDPDQPFIAQADFLQAVALLKRKKNIILQGPPGVGKTFIARKLAYQIMQEQNDAQIEMVQFHQSYSYEDFIQGLRPTAKGGFEIKEGIFYSFCQRALAHPERPFFFMIDEINRGNLSKIFGELMMLIEADKRSEQFALKLTYAEDQADRFYIPPNLYIVGMMNTADRSLAIVDYALRRRFAFVDLQPDFGSRFRQFLTKQGLSVPLVEHICSAVPKVNHFIQADPNLGEGFQIGHSYFCDFPSGEDEQNWWLEILQFELKPLLQEIWFDEAEQIEKMLQLLSR